VDPSELLVIVDDIHLPLGKLRIKPKGGSGGHNGIQDIIDWLDTDEFPRLRIGVGSEFQEGKQSDYVLSPFAAEEEELVADVLKRSMNAALTFVVDGIQTTMNRFNTKG
jgi:PTH1 family peptidyl-tRNA hydrolase